MKRRTPIPALGHVETAGPVPAAVGCKQCQEMRLKSQPWKRPCAAAQKAQAA